MLADGMKVADRSRTASQDDPANRQAFTITSAMLQKKNAAFRTANGLKSPAVSFLRSLNGLYNEQRNFAACTGPVIGEF
jgi:hypothetical protein